ncbi:MAG: hypothetical protein E4G95_02530 [Bacteroidia bacterium]|nr:MAG: hypothetical protein E4G95_02530 [Bacteroidia bacterium]
MTIDNGKTIIRLRLNVFIATVLFIIYLYFAYYGRGLKFPLLGFTATQLSLILLGIYFLVAFYPMILGYNYLYFSDDGPSIVLRYYSAGIIKGRKNSIEIPRKTFVGYKISGNLFSKKIALIQRLDRRDAVYPPINITSLNSDERKRLFAMLDKYGQPE